MDFQFRLTEDRTDVDRLTQFILAQSWGYEGFDDWVERARQELIWGHKEAMIALSYGTLAGSLMFQPCKNIKGFCEMKNARTLDGFQNGHIQNFMIR